MIFDMLAGSLEDQGIFWNRGHFFYCVMKYLNRCHELILNKIFEDYVPTLKNIGDKITLSLPVETEQDFLDVYRKVYGKGFVKTQGQCFQAIFIFLGNRSDNMEFWGRILTWFLIKQEEETE